MKATPLVACAATVVAFATVGAAASAVAATPEPDGPLPAPPDDWVELVDATGTIGVLVPPEWGDIVTDPVYIDGVNATPNVGAATDLPTFFTSFDAAGIAVLALPYNPNTAATLQHYGLAGGCLEHQTDAYDDGALAGEIRHWTRCGGGTSTEVFNLAVAPADRSLTLAIHLQVLDPDDRWIVDTILAALALIPGGDVTTGPPRTLFDELEAIVVQVPAAWDEIALHRDDKMPDALASIVASTDLDNFLDDPGVAGVGYHAEPYTPNTDVRLDELDTYGCQARPASKYTDDIFTGHVRTATCGSTGVRQVQIVATPIDATFTAVLTIRVAPLSNDELQLVVDTFSYNPIRTDDFRQPGRRRGPHTTLVGNLALRSGIPASLHHDPVE